MMPEKRERMFIIGARGFLGIHAVRAASGVFEVSQGVRTIGGRADEVPIDITDQASVRAAFQIAKPDVVVLLAAMSDIDRCEVQRDEASAVNVSGAENVAQACAGVNARLLFTSSAAVFDGRKHGYKEDTPPSPVSFYGQTKADAEAIILCVVPTAIVVRIALAVGFSGKPDTNTLLDSLAKRWAAGEEVLLPTFEHRNPIDAHTLSRFLLNLLDQPSISGIFHIGATESISRYELGLRFAERMGYPGLIQPQYEPTPGRALRGPDQFLRTNKIRALCTIPIPTCEQVIERCFRGAA